MKSCFVCCLSLFSTTDLESWRFKFLMSRCFGNHVALSLLAISLKKSGSSGITRTRTRIFGYPKCRVSIIRCKFRVIIIKTRNFKNPKNPTRNFPVSRMPTHTCGIGRPLGLAEPGRPPVQVHFDVACPLLLLITFHTCRWREPTSKTINRASPPQHTHTHTPFHTLSPKALSLLLLVEDSGARLVSL